MIYVRPMLTLGAESWSSKTIINYSPEYSSMHTGSSYKLSEFLLWTRRNIYWPGKRKNTKNERQPNTNL
jgi:hypothetical protein